MMSVRNLAYLREKDPRLHEALADIIRQQSAIAEQVNGNAAGQPLPPPAVTGLRVTGSSGHFDIAIQDQGQIYRDVHYYVEHADNPQFTNPSVVHLGHSRNHNVFLGNVSRYWRAYSAYASSPAGPPAYHGSPTDPIPVLGGGSIPGPEFQPSQGSGTGAPGEGLSGPGPIPFRSPTGAPPVRGGTSKASGSGAGSLTRSIVGVPVSGMGSVSSPGGGGSLSSTAASMVQSALAAFAAGLNTASAGVSVYVSDYDHTLVWNGAGWRYASGERSGFIQAFLVDPSPATGWALCDGSSVTYLKSDGTLGTVTIPDLTSTSGKASYLKFGATAAAALNPAVAPTVSMGSFTPAGTVSQPSLSMSSYTPAGTVSQPSFTGAALAAHSHLAPLALDNIYLYASLDSCVIAGVTHSFGGVSATTFNPSTRVLAASYTSQQSAINVLSTDSVSAGTPAGAVSQPTFTGTAATLTGTVSQPTFTGTAATLTGTASANGEPQNVILRPWFRK